MQMVLSGVGQGQEPEGLNKGCEKDPMKDGVSIVVGPPASWDEIV